MFVFFLVVLSFVIRHGDVSRMQGGRHVTDDCTRRRRHMGVPNLERRPDWTSRCGICVCSNLAVYRTSVYSLLKCIELLMYVT